MRGETIAPSPLTLAEFSSRFLERYAADRAPATVSSLQWRLVRPLREFGDLRLTELRTGELAAWEASLPPRFRHDVVRALRMVLDAAVAWQHLAANPAKATGKNPSPPVVERAVLEPGDVERLAREMTHPYDVAIIVGAWCYLRPSELLALERGDVGDGVLSVRGTKTARSRRTVPLPLRASEALQALPPRLDTRLLFPSRAPHWDHAIHASPLGHLVGAPRGHPRERRRAVRRYERDDARDPLPPSALDERGGRTGQAGRVQPFRPRVGHGDRDLV
ncbi:MAG: site-specific integrase [Gaiellaceae bacterium]